MDCPFCGADTGGRRALFCAKCGRRLTSPEAHTPPEEPGIGSVSEPEGPAEQPAGGWMRTLTVLVMAATLLMLVAGVGVLATYLGLRDRAQTITEAADVRYHKGEAHLAAEEYELAIAEFELVLQLQPGHADAANGLERAREALQARPSPTPILRQEINAAYYGELSAAHAQEDWARVVELADLLWSVDPSYRREDVEGMLFDAFYQSALALVREERLEEAIRLFDRAMALDPGHDEARKQRERAALYVNGLSYWGADWPAALAHLMAVYQQDPGYLDVQERIYEGRIRYGDAMGRDGDWCEAATQYGLAYTLTQTEEAATKQAFAEDRCRVMTETGDQDGTVTPPGTRVPSGVFAGRLTEQTVLDADKIYIRGRIVDEEGRGVDGARVEISAWDWSVVHTSSGNGQFSFDGLNQPVTYTLRLLDFPCIPLEVPTEWGKISWVLFEETP